MSKCTECLTPCGMGHVATCSNRPPTKPAQYPEDASKFARAKRDIFLETGAYTLPKSKREHVPNPAAPTKWAVGDRVRSIEYNDYPATVVEVNHDGSKVRVQWDADTVCGLTWHRADLFEACLSNVASKRPFREDCKRCAGGGRVYEAMTTQMCSECQDISREDVIGKPRPPVDIKAKRVERARELLARVTQDHEAGNDADARISREELYEYAIKIAARGRGVGVAEVAEVAIEAMGIDLA